MNTNNDKYRSLLGSIRDVVSEEKIPNFSPGGETPQHRTPLSLRMVSSMLCLEWVQMTFRLRQPSTNE